MSENEKPQVQLDEAPGIKFDGDDTEGHYTRPVHNDEGSEPGYTRPVHNDEDDTEGHLSRPVHNDGEVFGFSGSIKPDPNVVS